MISYRSDTRLAPHVDCRILLALSLSGIHDENQSNNAEQGEHGQDEYQNNSGVVLSSWSHRVPPYLPRAPRVSEGPGSCASSREAVNFCRIRRFALGPPNPRLQPTAGGAI